MSFAYEINRNVQSSLLLFCILSQLLHMKPLHTIPILLYLLLPGFYKKANAQVQQTEARIDSLMQHYQMVGLAVAVVKKGRMIYTHSFGKKNIATGTPLTDNDMFRIASISKIFFRYGHYAISAGKKAFPR